MPTLSVSWMKMNSHSYQVKYQSTNHTPHPPPHLFLSWWPWGLTIHPHGMEHRQHMKAWMPTLLVSWMKMNSHSYQVSTKAPIIHPTPTPFIPLMMTLGLNYTSTWNGAQTTCEGINANLVSILDENEQSFLSSKYQSTNHTPHPHPIYSSHDDPGA